MTTDIHRRLREATQAAHARLEARAGILEQIASPGGRRAIVMRFHWLHADIEAAAAPWLVDLPALAFETRRRTRLLEQDMAALDIGEFRPTPGGVQAGGAAEALGLMYVLEGSTLGGRLIESRVRSAGGNLQGLSFLNPYGRHTSLRWRAFLAVAEDLASDPAAAVAMVRGAVAGFDHAERCLCAEPVHA